MSAPEDVATVEKCLQALGGGTGPDERAHIVTTFERLGLPGEVDEEEPLPGGDADRPQGPVGLVESLEVGGAGRPDQPPVERVGPGMVGALDGLGKPAGVLLTDPSAPVAADVEVRPVAAGPVPQHDHALAADLLHEPVARIGDPVFPPHAEPALEEDLLHLLRQ